MKTNHFKKLLGALMILLCIPFGLHAQPQRFGGGPFGGGGGFGGGGFGGFGGFGGGGFGANNFNRGATSSGQYNNNGAVGSAVISVDPVTHNIVVIADRVTSEQIRRVIESLDAPEPQVLIRAVFLEVTDLKASDIGFQGSYTGHNGTFGQVTGFLTNSFSIVTNVTQNGNGGSTLTPTLIPNITPVQQSFNLGQSFGLPQSLAGAAGSGGLYQLIGSDFTGTIQAIAALGKAQVLSRPSILARDGQMAEIVVGQSIYLPSGVAFTAVGGSATTVPTINGNYQNVGIQLDVTPFIGANSLIQMILEPQITSIDSSSSGQQIVGSTLFSGAVFAPNINKRSANTVVVTPDGQTVVVGGLISNQKSENESKVPFLGDIPILGNLFKFTAKSDQKTDLIIFLTPHIVGAPSMLPAMTNPEMGQAPMITNSVSEQELDRFLERVPAKKTK